MKRVFLFLIALIPATAFAVCNPFVANTVLTASALNSAIAGPCITSGTITGAAIDNAIIGAGTPAAGKFTTLTTTSTIEQQTPASTGLVRHIVLGTRGVREFNDVADGGYNGLTAATVSEFSQSFNAIFTLGVGFTKDRSNAGDHASLERLDESFHKEFWFSDGTAPASPVAWVRKYRLDLTTGNLEIAGALTPSTTGGIVGTTTNNNATAGSVGEHVTASAASTVVALTTATAANMTSISLTAGDWDVSGTCVFQTAATTSVTLTRCGVSTTSATFGADGTYTSSTFAAVVPGAVEYADAVSPVTRVSLAATTTVYLVGLSNFTVSTQTAGGVIRARRVR